MVLNKSAVKKLFNRDGVQVNVLALNYIDEWAYKAVLDMIESAQSQGLKRVKPKNISSVCPMLLWEPLKDA